LGAGHAAGAAAETATAASTYPFGMSSPATGAATLAPRRSSRFVAWVRAWRAGLVPFDEVADEIAGDEEHLVADAPGTWTDVSLREALPSLAKLSPDEIRLVLPAPGDPRARRLYARASVLDRVLALAEHVAPGGAVNGYEAQQRDAALRPLVGSCRRALVAACNAPMI